jgi:hypothetical protein
VKTFQDASETELTRMILLLDSRQYSPVELNLLIRWIQGKIPEGDFSVILSLMESAGKPW